MPVSSLESIASRVLTRASPPSIAALIAVMERSEEYAEFMRIVHEVVPESKADIKREHSIAARVAMFATAFENRYFPLHPMFAGGMAESYEDITEYIPIILRSIDWDNYRGFSGGEFRPGLTLLAYLIGDPWQEGEGERIALAETCVQWVPQHILQRVPEEISRTDIHALLDGTRFESVGIVADILHMTTHNCFYDEDQESVHQGAVDLEWRRENVEVLTQKWLQAEVIDDKECKLYEWLEEDLPQRFTELIDFIEERKKFLKLVPQELVDKFQPSKAVIQWMNNLIGKLSLDGIWGAPVGFIFRKTGPREWTLISRSDTPACDEVLDRTLAVCRVAGITVIQDLQARLSIGGEHGINEGRAQRVPAITMAAPPDP